MDHYQPQSTTRERFLGTGISGNSDDLPEKGATFEPPILELIHRLSQALKAESITCCHWKSNNALDRSATGVNDLDFLISRGDASRFTEILFRLGFKKAQAPAEKQMPGVQDYFGYDAKADKWVHVHAHYQLIMGHDMTKNFRLALERPYLESAVQGELFQVPAVEFEFIVFVIRMILKHSTWDAILGREGKLSNRERQELVYLQERAEEDHLIQILQHHLPYIDLDLFRSCVQALQPSAPLWSRIRTGQQLQNRLRANAVYPLPIDAFLKLWRRAILIVRRRIFKSPSKYRLETGGALIAIVGGDGAGKSTAVNALHAWLSRHFQTKRVHFGKPAWSLTTMTLRSILKLGSLLGLYPTAASMSETLSRKSLISPGYPWLLREVCRARDRYQTYLEAQRFAAKGGLVILDRFPVPQIRLMDGPLTAEFVQRLTSGPQSRRWMSPRANGGFASALVRKEESYYREIRSPEVLIVLRLDPEIAVQRKVEEDAAYVRERSAEIWRLNWEQTDAHVIDGSQSKEDVLKKLKALLWSQL